MDPDLLDEEFNERREERGREIVMGVEVNEHGRPLAYHFWPQHPDDMRRRERVRIPASDITHHFIRYRAGQTRGFSGFAAVLTTVEMIDGYTEAELVAARYHASKMGFIETTDAEAVALWAQRLAIQNESGKDPKPKRIKMSPGAVEHLTPGSTFNGFDPSHPNTAFDPFLTALMRGVARGTGMSYLTLTGDVSAANYSSMRAGLLPERDHWRVLQNTTAKRLHRPVYRAWLDMGLLSGALDLRSPVSADYYPVEWRGRRWQWVDPKNDLEAAEKEISLGINSRQRLTADRGLDYETVIDETAEDEKYAEEQGVDVTVVRRSESGQAVQDEPEATPPKNGKGATSRLAPYGA
jgi:lambda family phage portal protein